MSLLAMGAVAFYVLLLLAMLVYGANSVLLVWVHWREARNGAKRVVPPADERFFVTVQLPIYNERAVVIRLLDAAARLDWPSDRLEIQLLDDSDDDTSAIAAEHVAVLQARGVPVVHVRRPDRTGYKAGALKYGMARTPGELLAIFDADFVPPPDFLRRAVGHFSDPGIACVQGRWTHLNREWSWLTRAQALAIDGHFGVEQAARDRAGWFMNFNGTAGIWRRAAIDDAGGWTADTLTEDLDLSYRAQLAGWRMVFDADLACPAELPVDMPAFKAQQRRWATGSMQAARKLLPAIWKSESRLGAKLQATIHLTHYAIHPLIGLTALLSVPCVLLPGVSAGAQSLWTLLVPFALAMSGPTLLYLYGQRVLGRPARPALRSLGALTLVGIGICVSNARAVLSALRGPGGEFVRTPKHGITDGGGSAAERPHGRAYQSAGDGLRWLELSLGVYCLAAAVALIWTRVYVIAPFMLLDAAGFLCVASSGGRLRQGVSE